MSNDLTKKEAADLIAKERWSTVLKALGDGVLLPDALKQGKMLYREVEQLVLKNGQEQERYDAAVLQGKAARFSLVVRDAVFEAIAAGEDPESAILDLVGAERAKEVTSDFFALISAVPAWDKLYAAATQTAQLRDRKKLTDLVDDKSDDVLNCPKKGLLVNNAAVNRSRLRWEHRKWEMACFNPKRFSEKVQIEAKVTHDYARLLEEARQRRDTQQPTHRIIDVSAEEVAPAPRITQETQEAAFRPIVNEESAQPEQSTAPARKDDTSEWDDTKDKEPPLSSVWLEEK